MWTLWFLCSILDLAIQTFSSSQFFLYNINKQPVINPNSVNEHKLWKPVINCTGCSTPVTTVMIKVIPNILNEKNTMKSLDKITLLVNDNSTFILYNLYNICTSRSRKSLITFCTKRGFLVALYFRKFNNF